VSGVEWPVALHGVTETVVTTLGPNGRWNLAALGIEVSRDETSDGTPDVTARTWGRTRTRRNFSERGGGYVQFTRDPVRFVEAALTVTELDDPILEDADAWVRVDVRRLDAGEEDGTEWVDWALVPRERGVDARVVPAFNRGYAAVVEATIAASRLGVAAYDDERLRERVEYFEGVAQRCGGHREREAFRRLLAALD